MKNSPYDPYLYNPNNPYLAISPQSTPSAQLQTQEQSSSQEVSEPSTFSQSLPAWLYSHLDYCFIAIFLIFVLLMIKLVFSIIAF